MARDIGQPCRLPWKHLLANMPHLLHSHIDLIAIALVFRETHEVESCSFDVSFRDMLMAVSFAISSPLRVVILFCLSPAAES